MRSGRLAYISKNEIALSQNKGIEQDVPDWHKEIVRRRMEDYQRKPDQAIDFDMAMDGIEKNDINVQIHHP